MKLVLAAPASFLPSEPKALASQESCMHFVMNEVLAAPASGLLSLPIALLSQESCAKAVPAAKVAITAAKIIRFIVVSPWTKKSGRIGTWNCAAIKLHAGQCAAINSDR